MSIDNWRHRDATLRCGFCMWFVEKTPPLGRCRRRAPELGGWPAVFVQDWCGDHKLDDVKYNAVLVQRQRMAGMGQEAIKTAASPMEGISRGPVQTEKTAD